MAPIYDFDVAEERWAQSEWSSYELWERVEHRLRRNRRLWIALTVVVFLLISSLPVVFDQRPRWTAIWIARKLAFEVNRVKLDAALTHDAYRIRFEGSTGMDFVVEKAPSCSSSAFTEVRRGTLPLPDKGGTFVLLEPRRAEELAIPGLVNEFCYDPLQGRLPWVNNQPNIGFAIAPANDLTEKRVDRLAILLLSGQSAETSFD